MLSKNQRIDAFRRFNRFYTKKIGVLHRHLLDTTYGLAEARVLYELAQQEKLTAGQLVNTLDIDAGYMSRILSSFKENGLIARNRSQQDGRQRIIKLTKKGRREFSGLNRRARNQIQDILNNVTEGNQNRLLKAMLAIEQILGKETKEDGTVLIRTHRPGDIGWIVERHGALYNEEYRFDETFEALVAGILARLIQSYNHRKDHIWIAEIDGERVGSIVIADGKRRTAKLRLFLVEPRARGRGIGKMLFNESIRFARQAGYRRVILWTQSILGAARHIYESNGFKLISSESHNSFGHDLVAEVWELKL